MVGRMDSSPKTTNTPEAQAMAAVVKFSAPTLKAEGFRKRRHSFNRATTDGMVHVINFWQAPKEPPAWTEVPGLRERLYGTFRIDVGVWLPEMKRMGTPRSDWINEYNCHLRRTIGQLMRPDDRGDLWWPLFDPDAAAVAKAALLGHALPWLARFPSKESVIESFERDGPLTMGMGPAGGLEIADLYGALGRCDDERRTLETYVTRGVLKSHAVYLEKYLVERGYPDLVGQIKTRD